MAIEVRNVTRDDEEALIDICFITGDPFLKEVFPDPYLFSSFWCLYYVWYEAQNSFVAIDSKTKKVVGYIICSTDTNYQEKDFKKKMYPIIKDKMKELKLYSLKAKLITNFIINKPKSLKRSRILKEFPAHLHINILPEYQRQGIGHKLMKRLEEHLIKSEIIGFHLEVGSENIQGISFYNKIGLKLKHKNRMGYTFCRNLALQQRNIK